MDNNAFVNRFQSQKISTRVSSRNILRTFLSFPLIMLFCFILLSLILTDLSWSLSIEFGPSTPKNNTFSTLNNLFIEVDVKNNNSNLSHNITSLFFYLFNESFSIINLTNKTINSTGTYNTSFLLPNEGRYYYKVVIYNTLSKTSINTTETRLYTYDKSPPIIKITSPKNRTLIKVHAHHIFIDVNYTVYDKYGLDNCSLYINNNLISYNNGENFTNITLGPGDNKFFIRCCDLAFNCVNSSHYIITFQPTNNPPYFLKLPTKQIAYLGHNYHDSFIVNDSDKDNLSYVINGTCLDYGNLNMSSNSSNSNGNEIELIFSPNRSALNVTCSFIINVLDTYTTISYSYEIFITTTKNHAPKILTNLTHDFAIPRQAYSLKINASDDEDDILSYELIQAPTGMTIDKNRGIISFLPTEAQLGDHQVIINISDGINFTIFSYYLSVVKHNVDPITFLTEPLTVAILNTPYVYDVDAIDFRNNNVSYYELVESPENMTINASTGVIRWLPKHLGKYNVSVVAFSRYGDKLQQDYVVNVHKSCLKLSKMSVSVPHKDTHKDIAYPGDNIKTELEFENLVNDTIYCEYSIYLSYDNTTNADPITDEEGNEVLTQGDFELEPYKDEASLSNQYYRFYLNVPLNLEDDTYFYVIFKTRCEYNHTYYEDYIASSKIKFEKLDYDVLVESFEISPETLSCHNLNNIIKYDPITIQLFLRNVGKKDIVLGYVLSSDIFEGTNGSTEAVTGRIRLTNNYEDISNYFTTTHKLVVKSNLTPGTYPIYLELYFDNHKDTITKFVNLICESPLFNKTSRTEQYNKKTETKEHKTGPATEAHISKEQDFNTLLTNLLNTTFALDQIITGPLNYSIFKQIYVKVNSILENRNIYNSVLIMTVIALVNIVFILLIIRVILKIMR